jgi:hypothetical protein
MAKAVRIRTGHLQKLNFRRMFKQLTKNYFPQLKPNVAAFFARPLPVSKLNF